MITSGRRSTNSFANDLNLSASPAPKRTSDRRLPPSVQPSFVSAPRNAVTSDCAPGPLMALFGHGARSWLSPLSGVQRKSDFGAVRAAFDPERTSQSQSRPVVPARGPDLSRRVADLKRCTSSSIFSAFSSSWMSFDFLGASLRRSLSSSLRTESLFISAIVTYSAPRGVVERRFERSSSARPAGAACPKISVPLRYVNSLELTFACDRSPSSPRSRGLLLGSVLRLVNIDIPQSTLSH